ncbi:MAG TPA: amino acid ABC transporter substrate-binding protein [Anaerolineae bacterium]|nr:amino acid ABC transporter substrate-binding protein [Anaerolineae bacterium]
MHYRQLLPVILLLTLFLTACSTPETIEVTRIVVATPTSAPAANTDMEENISILDQVRARGHLICGSRDTLVGFGYLDENGQPTGFDIDLCRAVAVAVLGDADAIEVVNLATAERGPALTSRQVDVLARTATWTSSREAQWGNFTLITFYDGQGFMVGNDSGITSINDLDNQTICVNTGTTTETNLQNMARQRGLNIEIVAFEGAGVYDAYEAGECAVATSDKSALLSRRSTFANPNAHIILDETISKEPLTPAVPAGDDEWLDIVRLVLYVLVNAEELNVTSQNVTEMLDSDNIDIRRMLGVEQDFGQAQLRLNQDFAVDIIRDVGNYGEIYARYFGPNSDLPLERGPNALWTDGGLIYAPPLK